MMYNRLPSGTSGERLPGTNVIRSKVYPALKGNFILKEIPSAPILTTGNLGATAMTVMPRFNGASSPKEVFNAAAATYPRRPRRIQVPNKPNRKESAEVRGERSKQPHRKSGSGSARSSVRKRPDGIRTESTNQTKEAKGQKAPVKKGRRNPTWLKKFQFKKGGK